MRRAGHMALRALYYALLPVAWVAMWVFKGMTLRRWPAVTHRTQRLSPWMYLGFAGMVWLPQSWTPWELILGLSLAANVCVLSGSDHGSVLCTRCAAAFPMDGPERAERREGRLYGYHRYGIYVMVLWLVLVVSAVFWSGVVDSGLVSGANLLMGTWMGRYVLTHGKLQLWCPWCDDGDDGGDDDVYEPEPDPADQVPA